MPMKLIFILVDIVGLYLGYVLVGSSAIVLVRVCMCIFDLDSIPSNELHIEKACGIMMYAHRRQEDYSQ